MKPLILTIDQGTTSSRAIVYDEAGKPLYKAQRALELIFPQQGWVEVDAIDLWHSVLAVVTETISQPAVESGCIVALAITNQRETTVVWDRKTGLPIAKAIVWQSRQTAEICAGLRQAGAETMIRAKTGLPLDPYFSASKIRFILDAVPDAQVRAEQGELLCGTIDTWLIWQLTGGKVHATDSSNASRTMLFNIHSGQWDDELLNLFDIPRLMLPEIRDSAGDFGRAQLADLTIPILAVLGDQQAALYGQNCLQKGAAKSTFGTGGFLLMNTGTTPVSSDSGLLTTVAWRLDGQTTYALEGSFFTAGSALSWLQDSLHLIADPGEADQLAKAADTRSAVHFVPALSGLGTPWWNDRVRASFMGMTQGTGKEELVRSVFEAVAYQTATIFNSMQAESQLQLTTLQVDGGLVLSDFFLAFLSDILQIEIGRPVDFEVTALGVTLLAGLEAGCWSDIDIAARTIEVGKTFRPGMTAEESRQRLKDWQRAIEQACSYY